MNEKNQRTALALIAAGLAVAAIVTSLVRLGKMPWGGLVVLALAYLIWRGRDQNAGA